MEDSPATEETIRHLSSKLRERYEKSASSCRPTCAAALEDVDAASPRWARNVRLCKGIYVEPRAIAFKDPGESRRSYVALAREAAAAGGYVGIATHDRVLVERRSRLVDRLRLPQRALRVPDAARRRGERCAGVLVADGHRLRVYVPYGRRLVRLFGAAAQGKPAIAGHVVKGLFLGN